LIKITDEKNIFPSAACRHFYSAQQNEIKVDLLKIADISYERKLMPQWFAGQHVGTGLIKD